jgi:hypothetical protein
MVFHVLLDYGSLHPRDPSASVIAAHLAVDGADETLCCEPVDRLLPTVPAGGEDTTQPWCGVCPATAAT